MCSLIFDPLWTGPRQGQELWRPTTLLQENVPRTEPKGKERDTSQGCKIGPETCDKGFGVVRTRLTVLKSLYLAVSTANNRYGRWWKATDLQVPG
jgi:hypothetical protein